MTGTSHTHLPRKLEGGSSPREACTSVLEGILNSRDIPFLPRQPKWNYPAPPLLSVLALLDGTYATRACFCPSAYPTLAATWRFAPSAGVSKGLGIWGRTIAPRDITSRLESDLGNESPLEPMERDYLYRIEEALSSARS